MGIVCAGFSAVTLPTMLTRDALAAAMEDSAARVLFASAPYVEIARHVAEGNGHLLQGGLIAIDGEDPEWIAYGPWRDSQKPDSLMRELSPDDEFNIVYSSGTTGVPKGIVHTHRTRAVIAAGIGSLCGCEDATTLLSTPLYTNLSLPAFFGSLWRGGRTIVQEKFDPLQYLQLAVQERATHFFLVPAQVQRLLAVADFDSMDLSATRLIYVGGSLFSSELKQEVLRRWSRGLLEVYGMTEGAPMTAHFVDRDQRKLTSVGQAVGGSEVRIVDEEGRELAMRQVGEIVACSNAMTIGYNNRADLTQALIWLDSRGRRFFRSGDLGYLDEDGYVYVVGRKKDMIISGGLNIYAADLEAVIAQHPAVAEVAVIAVPSERWGETPLAVVVPKDATVEPREVGNWANDRLAKHQRVGLVVYRGALPRNALGKVLKQDLCAEFRDVGQELRR